MNKTMKSLCLCLSFIFISCDGMFTEDCIYMGTIEGRLIPDKVQDEIPVTSYRMAYYPEDGLGVGKIDGTYDVFNTDSTVTRKIYIGIYGLLTYNIGNCTISDSTSLNRAYLRCPTKTEEGVTLITRDPGLIAYSYTRAAVLNDETTHVDIRMKPLTRRLRINARFMGSEANKGFMIEKAELSGIYTGAFLASGITINESGTSIMSFERTNKDKDVFSSTMNLFGLDESSNNIITLHSKWDDGQRSFNIDLSESLSMWNSFYREIDIEIKVGGNMEPTDIKIKNWEDKEWGEILMEPDIE